jgi:hypothetical protein
MTAGKAEPTVCGRDTPETSLKFRQFAFSPFVPEIGAKKFSLVLLFVLDRRLTHGLKFQFKILLFANTQF